MFKTTLSAILFLFIVGCASTKTEQDVREVTAKVDGMMKVLGIT